MGRLKHRHVFRRTHAGGTRAEPWVCNCGVRSRFMGKHGQYVSGARRWTVRPAGVVRLQDLRPTCKVCGRRWVPSEGVDASQVPCRRCRKRLGIPVSKDGWILVLNNIGIWAEAVGDAGQLWWGHARCGAHSFRTATYYQTRVGALVAGLGLVAAWLADVTTRYGDDTTNGKEKPPPKPKGRKASKPLFHPDDPGAQ